MAYPICLDAGHGGTDSGAVYGSFVEKALTLKIVNYMYKFLDADANYTPVLTRTKDAAVTIDARASTGNKANAAIFLSVHFNAGGGKGIEVYPHVPAESFHKESYLFAEKVVDNMRDLVAQRGLNGIRYAYLVNGQRSFAESNDTNNKGHSTYFGVVRQSKSPAVLIETAFIDTASDMTNFNSDAKLKVCAARYYRAICDYFKTVPIFDSAGNATALYYKINTDYNDGKWNATQKGAYDYTPAGLIAAIKDYEAMNLFGYYIFDPYGNIVYPPIQDNKEDDEQNELDQYMDAIMELQSKLKVAQARISELEGIVDGVRGLVNK